MKKYFLVFALLIISGTLVFGQSNSDCDSTKWAKEGTYLVKIVEGTVESTDVRPRELTSDEKCFIEQNRHLTNDVIFRFDLYTEVIIYSKNKISEK
ncbi:MAG: hypothetical protein ACK4IK_04010 [Bacteroidia bacterium]